MLLPAVLVLGGLFAGGLGLALLLRNIARGSRILSGLLQTPIAIPHLAIAVLLVNVIGQSGVAARLARFAGLIQVPADFPALVNDRYAAGISIAYVLKE